MDEWILNDLLECSVCLERLDTSSKVLPCQHTFCKKCLEEIICTHKELRCPECRILVDCSIEELPPNVLLMRILEGMKNAGNLVPKKKVSNFQKQSPVQISSQQTTPNQAYNNSDNIKPQNAVQKQFQNHLPYQPCGRALCDYVSKEPGDLSFRKGEIIYLHRRVDARWYQGQCGGKTGIFPSSHIQVIIPVTDQVATCKALYDFRMVNDEDEGCLSFHKDDIITVIRRVDENWAEGKLNGHIGIFPLAFVEMNNIAQALMKVSINSQPGPSRVAPPTPTAEESTPLIPTDCSNHVCVHPPTQNNIGSIPHHNTKSKAQALAPSAVTGVESGSTVSSSTSTPSSSSITPNSSSNTSSSSNSEPNSPPSSQPIHGQNPFLTAPQPPRQMMLQTSHITNSAHGVLPTSHIMSQQPVAGSEQFADPYCHWSSAQTRDIFAQHAKEKRHSFSAVSANHHNCSNSNKHGTEVTVSESASDNQNGHLIRHGSQRHKRSGSDKTSAVNLPAGYIALYPYKPQKADELELKKGGVYLVTEMCQDGWFKGTSSKTQKSGMFPGNYVTLAKPVGTVQGQPRGTPTRESAAPSPSQKALPQPKHGKNPQMYARQLVPPELPPRASSPSARVARMSVQNSSTSWYPQNEFSSAQKIIGESTPPQANMAAPSSDSRAASASASPVLIACSKSSEKVKDKKEKSGLMKRLATMKRSKSPPATASYSMDNPVFDDAPASSQVQSHSHNVHLRSGSCPSQLIQVNVEALSASLTAKLMHRERPTVSNANFTHSTSRPSDGTVYSKPMPAAGSSHRKSSSLDAGDATRKPKQLVPPVRERFKCIVAYPPNSEYELELKVGDIIYVHKKREDGWYKGTQERTGRTGLFPASFVETC